MTRILAPYKVAIIDYLQAADYSKHSIPYEPFTIMPNLKFELRNYVTGHSYGFAAVPLQRIRLGRGSRESSVGSCQDVDWYAKAICSSARAVVYLLDRPCSGCP